MVAKELRVIHLPSITGNNAWYLSNHEKPIISKSIVAYFSDSNKNDLFNELKYDKNIEFNNWLIGGIKILSFYIWAFPKFDIFHFNAGSALFRSPKIKLLDFLDIKLLRLFKKKVVFTFQGSPGRLKSSFYNRLKDVDEIYQGVFDKSLDEKLKQRRINIVNKYSSLIYCTNPDLLHNFDINKSSFRPYTKMNLSPFNQKVFNDKLRIVHFPTNRKIKGSDFIDRIVSEIIDEGFNIEYLSLSGVENTKIKELIRSSDILIDQMLIGWYGGIAIEAMNFGVPVVSYINGHDLKFIPDQMRLDLPIISADLLNLKSTLINLIVNPNSLYEISNRSYNFLYKWHDSEKIATKIVSDYLKLFQGD